VNEIGEISMLGFGLTELIILFLIAIGLIIFVRSRKKEILIPIKESKNGNYYMKKRNSLGTILFIIIILAIIFVSSTVDLITCPECNNNFLIKHLCNACGHDGKITILYFILYIFQ